jgi:hypothetical protein
MTAATFYVLAEKAVEKATDNLSQIKVCPY